MFHTEDVKPIVNIRVSILNLKKALRQEIESKAHWCNNAPNSKYYLLFKDEVALQQYDIEKMQAALPILDGIYRTQSLTKSEYHALQNAHGYTHAFIQIFHPSLTIKLDDACEYGAQLYRSPRRSL